jgi:hypothetical protein
MEYKKLGKVLIHNQFGKKKGEFGKKGYQYQKTDRQKRQACPADFSNGSFTDTGRYK